LGKWVIWQLGNFRNSPYFVPISSSAPMRLKPFNSFAFLNHLPE